MNLSDRTSRLPDDRTGFTIPELAIILSVVVCVLALMGPYLLRSWETSRQHTCRERLRGLAGGVIAFHQDKSFFPHGQRARQYDQDSVGRIADPEEARSTEDKPHTGQSWIVQILPHIGQKTIADNWKSDRSVLFNRTQAETEIAELYCPSRRSGMGATGPFSACEHLTADWSRGGCDYAACTGSGISFSQMKRQTYALTDEDLSGTLRAGVSAFTPFPQEQGLFGVNSKTTQTEVSEADGLSYVIMLSERRLSRAKSPESQRSSDGWAWGGPATSFSTRHAPHSGLDFSEADSEHPGLVHVVMVDGRLRRVNWNVDLQTWKNLGNITQGSPIVHPDFLR